MKTESTIDEIMRKLLFVPFNRDYRVEESIRRMLTEEEFFENCFVNPEFDSEIESVLKKSDDLGATEVEDFEFNLGKEELIQRLHYQREEYAALLSWIRTRQPDLYCIKGDAGTGKSTFLHYLKYLHQNEPIYWNIIDIQKATNEVSVLDQRVTIPDFQKLYAKATSAILINLANAIFPRENKKCLLDRSIDTIKLITNAFRERFDGYFPRKEVDMFFSGLSTSGRNTSAICRKNSEHISNWVKDIINTEGVSGAFSIILELYIYFVVCSGATEHHIIALDNFERFIGTEEIYNAQLTEFVSQLRRIQRAIYANNNLSYQIVVFMRNTSVRMFTSEQANELFPHSVDLSNWFDAGSVLRKKVDWYNSKKIHIFGTDVLLDIFNDMGACGDTLRGLHFKISMLFNYNKRLIIRFLADVIVYAVNETYLKKYKYYWSSCDKLKPSLNKFAARSIIFRLLLNSLRKDDFFVHIIEQTNCSEGDGQEFRGTGCARKILTILHNHYLENPHSIKKTYMDLHELVSKLYPSTDNAMSLLLDSGNNERLDTLSQVLFYMNYYDGRRENWLQFIDIQYNHAKDSNIVISTKEELRAYISSNSADIKIRITNSGIAYMLYVVSSFEFFSCKSITKKYHSTYFGDFDIPPLLCSIPTIDEIKNNNLASLTCVKTITVVLYEALSCIQRLNHSDNPVPFKASINSPNKSHQERIVNAHRGFIDNFVECILLLYADQRTKDAALDSKLNDLYREFLRLRDQYTVDYGLREDI